ncbi:hypothetical protein GCM10009854_04260 [Saccharopolyspora halophila]|uniref:Uncharacterized protein n=1 Tax=Saccharopolyspora halophila TaxID=405551 RepID=A0ABP5SIV8_9PSEU
MVRIRTRFPASASTTPQVKPCTPAPITSTGGSVIFPTLDHLTTCEDPPMRAYPALDFVN